MWQDSLLEVPAGIGEIPDGCIRYIATGCIIYAVILRYIFKSNFYGSDEVILLFAFWLYFMGAVYGSYEDSHIKADLVNVYVKNIRVKDFISLIAQVIMIIVNIVLIIWAWDYFLWGLEKMPRSTGLNPPGYSPKRHFLVFS